MKTKFLYQTIYQYFSILNFNFIKIGLQFSMETITSFNKTIIIILIKVCIIVGIIVNIIVSIIVNIIV